MQVHINGSARKVKKALSCHLKQIFQRMEEPSPIWQKRGRQDKLGTSSGQVQDKVHTDNSEIERLVAVIGKEQMSVKMMMEKLQLKGRDNFLRLYLFPALEEGFVTLLYPDKPRHPRQKYLLTVKGLALLSEL